MNLSKLAVAGFAALAMGAASASTPIAIEDGESLGINPINVGYLASGNGTSTYDFILQDTAGPGFFTTFDLNVTLTSLFRAVTVTASSVTDGASFSQVGTLSGDQRSLSFAGLAAGSYTLALTTSSRGSSGLLTGTVTAVPTVTPVPEAETYALALAGLGVVGLVAARRRKA